MQRRALTSQLSSYFAICNDLETFPSSETFPRAPSVQGEDGGNRTEKLPMPGCSPALQPPARGTLEAKWPSVSLLAWDAHSS